MDSNRICKTLIVSQIVLFLFVIYFVYSTENKYFGKVGVIRTSVLVENYKGMVEVNAVLNNRINLGQDKLDTLQVDLQKVLKLNDLTVNDLENMEVSELPKAVKVAKENFENYYRRTEERRSTEREKLIQGVLNQVNAGIANYAENNNFQIIIGQLASGNILYAKDAIDITEDVLKIMNEEYTGQVK